MGDLEILEVVVVFGFMMDNVEDLVNEFSIFSVMIFGLVVVSIGLVEDEVVGVEELVEWISMDSVYGVGFEIDEDSVGNIFVVGSLKE